jgi:hypothetical protein
MAIPLRRRATQPLAQTTSEGHEVKSCERQAVHEEEATKLSSNPINRATFRAGARKAG